MGRKPLRKHARESSNEDTEGKKKKQKVSLILFSVSCIEGLMVARL